MKHRWKLYVSNTAFGNAPTEPVTACDECGEELVEHNHDGECGDRVRNMGARRGLGVISWPIVTVQVKLPPPPPYVPLVWKQVRGSVWEAEDNFSVFRLRYLGARWRLSIGGHRTDAAFLELRVGKEFLEKLREELWNTDYFERPYFSVQVLNEDYVAGVNSIREAVQRGENCYVSYGEVDPRER